MPNSTDTPVFSGRVLYIEDNSTHLLLLQRIFDRYPGAELISAKDGAEGIELARRHQLDLILLDVKLPDMEGIDVLRELRSLPSTAGVPVIIMSADASDDRIRSMLANGAATYVTKPFDLKEFDAVLGSLTR